jgi:hypothetical protein
MQSPGFPDRGRFQPRSRRLQENRLGKRDACLICARSRSGKITVVAAAEIAAEVIAASEIIG